MILLRDIPIAIGAYFLFIAAMILEEWIDTEYGAIMFFSHWTVVVILFVALLENHRGLFSKVSSKILSNSLNVLVSAIGTVLIWAIGAWIYVNYVLTYLPMASNNPLQGDTCCCLAAVLLS